MSLIQHVVSTVDCAYGIQIDGLSFFYACKAYYSYKPLLEFLALTRRRLQNGQLFLDGSSSPSPRLPILDLPNELSHEIFELVFESLIEDQKLKVLDRLGLCPHAGVCELVAFHQKFPCEPEYVGYQVQACPCTSCAQWRREMREMSFEEGERGVCLVDCGTGEECCSNTSGDHYSTMYGETSVDSCCTNLADLRSLVMQEVFSEAEGEIFQVVTEFDLSVLAYPTIVPPFSTDHEEYLPAAPYLHPIVALPHVGTRFAQDVTVHCRSGEGRTKLRDHSLVQVPDEPRPSEEELGRFQSLALALRLVGAGEDAKEAFKPSMLIVQSLQVTNSEETYF